MPNIRSKIGAHNKTMLLKKIKKVLPSKACNCQKSRVCPLINSDKTGNYYLMEVEQYRKCLHENITKDYRKVSDIQLNIVYLENERLAKILDIEWRLEQTEKEMAFLTIKDHKSDFPGKVSYRLINPMKNPMGKVSKVLLQRINNEVRKSKRLTQWQSTQGAIKWFDNLKNKKDLTFFQFDIEKFYPSINDDLLIKALVWAKQFS